MSDLRKPSFAHRLLWCRLQSIEFPDSNTCRLNLAPGDCTDMSGAIKVARAITRHLEGFLLLRIETVAMGEPDTIYIRACKDSKWHAREVRR